MRHFDDDRLEQLAVEVDSVRAETRGFWTLVATGMILLMQPGFAFLEAGAVRAKNVKSILFKNLIDCAVGLVVWWLWGWGVSDFGFKKRAWTLFAFSNDRHAVRFVHSYAFATTSATIVGGAVAERIRFYVYLWICLFLFGCTYPLCKFSVWAEDGWLHK